MLSQMQMQNIPVKSTSYYQIIFQTAYEKCIQTKNFNLF